MLIAIRKKKLHFDKTAQHFEHFLFLLFGASLLSGSLVDLVSNRYFLIFNGLVLIYLYYLSSFSQNRFFLKRLSYFYIPIVLLQIAIIFRGDLSTMNPVLVFGNPIVAILYEAKEPIQSFLPF